MTHLPFKSAQYSSKVRSTVTEYGRALAPQNLLPRQSLSCHCGGSAMDRAQLLLVALPIVLLCSDIINLFTSVPPPKPVHDRIRPSRPKFQPDPQQKPIDFPKSSSIGGLGVGSNVNINFCFSCSYRGNAVTMKNLLETAFPGIDVILANHPPPLPKLLLSKVVPVAQFGIIGIIMAGEQIFPRLGFMTPPPWYYSLSANRLGSIASTWLLGNFFQSSLLSSGAFEVYCNGELVFSKLREHRFPDQSELRDLVGKKITNQALVTGVGGGIWS